MRTKLLAGLGLALTILVLVVVVDPPRPTRKRIVGDDDAVEPTPVVLAPRRRRPSRGPAAPRAPQVPAVAASQDSLVAAALDAQAATQEREAALEAIEAAALEEEQVARLAQLASQRELSQGLRQAAIDLLIEVAEEGSEAARLRAIELFETERARATEEPDIASLLADRDPQVRRAAASALGEASPEVQDQAIAALQGAFAQESDEGVIDAIASAIVRAGRDRAPEILDQMAQGAPPNVAAILARHRTDAAAVAPTAAPVPASAPVAPADGQQPAPAPEPAPGMPVPEVPLGGPPPSGISPAPPH